MTTQILETMQQTAKSLHDEAQADRYFDAFFSGARVRP
jgi:hypothetical protein